MKQILTNVHWAGNEVFLFHISRGRRGCEVITTFTQNYNVFKQFHALPLAIRRLLLGGMIIPIIASFFIHDANGVMSPGWVVFGLAGYWVLVFVGIWVYGEVGK